jgi:hypothetical protein
MLHEETAGHPVARTEAARHVIGAGQEKARAFESAPAQDERARPDNTLPAVERGNCDRLDLTSIWRRMPFGHIGMEDRIDVACVLQKLPILDTPIAIDAVADRRVAPHEIAQSGIICGRHAKHPCGVLILDPGFSKAADQLRSFVVGL